MPNCRFGAAWRPRTGAGGPDFSGVKTTPPHDIPEQPIKGYLPKGKNGELLTSLINQSHEVLKNSEINLTRRDLGENMATHIWLWGQGKAADVPSFESRFKKKGAMITAVDLLRGIANLIGWERSEMVPLLLRGGDVTTKSERGW